MAPRPKKTKAANSPKKIAKAESVSTANEVFEEAATRSKKNWTKLKGSLQTKIPLGKSIGKGIGKNLRKNITKNLGKSFSPNGDKPYLLTSMLPNMVTLLGLCAGVSALRFALMEKWEFAVLALLIAALLDTLDGALARMLNASSHFGAELDSLSDFASFGICPALIMYFVSLKSYGSLGWLFVLWFCVCGALRLARFNTRASPTWAKGFFTGTPITSSALLCLTPLVMHLGWPSQTLTLHPLFVGVWMAMVGFCMISRIPTFSVKKIEIPPKFLLPIVILLVVTVTAIISHPWRTLSTIMVLYICTFPLSYRAYKRLEAEMLLK